MIGPVGPVARDLHRAISAFHDDLRQMTTVAEIRNLRRELDLLAPRFTALLALVAIKDEQIRTNPEATYARELAEDTARWTRAIDRPLAYQLVEPTVQP